MITPLVPIASTASPTKACNSSASASACGEAARHQVEQQVLVEGAAGGAVAAEHVVGEDLQLRLVVELGVVGEQQMAWVIILPSVFWAPRRTTILPWNTPSGCRRRAPP